MYILPNVLTFNARRELSSRTSILRNLEMAWNADTTRALGLYKKIGRLIGIWPLEYHSLSSKIRVIFLVMTQVWFWVDLYNQMSIKSNCGTMSEIVDILSWIAVGISISVKLISLTIYQQNMEMILNSAVTDWSREIDQKSRHIMLRFAKIGRIGAYLQIFSSCSVGFLQITRCIPAMINALSDKSTSRIPACIPLWPACWVPHTMFHYIINFINQTILAIVVNVSYSGCDSFFFGAVMHLAGQFEELHQNPMYVGKTDDHEQQTQQFIKFIERHKHLIMLANKFEEAYNIIIIVHVGLNILLPCVSGIMLLISFQDADYVTVGGMTVRIFLAYLQLYIYSYVGDQLSSQARKIQALIYNSPWYDMSPNLVKDMRFVIMRCNYTFNLTAGKIYNMNISNFTGIVKTTMSYFSVIRLMFMNKD